MTRHSEETGWKEGVENINQDGVSSGGGGSATIGGVGCGKTSGYKKPKTKNTEKGEEGCGSKGKGIRQGRRRGKRMKPWDHKDRTETFFCHR